MKTSLWHFLSALLLFPVLLAAQLRPDSTQVLAQEELQSRFDNSLSVVWHEQRGTADIITLGKPRSLAPEPINSAAAFLEVIRPLLKYRENDDELRIERTTEKRGIWHIRFKQYYKNVPVMGGEYVVTVLGGGKVRTALGGFYKAIELDVTPRLSARQALSHALQDAPPGVTLVDSLRAATLVIYPKDGSYYLTWKIRPAVLGNLAEWVYFVDASVGTILERFDEVIYELPQSAIPSSRVEPDIESISEHVRLLVPQPRTNAYLRHPGLDGGYTLIDPANMNYSGYIQGTYADAVNDAAPRAYDPDSYDFAFGVDNTHFDEGNLFYHIDRFRIEFWNYLDASPPPFTQIVAHAHTPFSPPNASYNPNDHHLRFSDGAGWQGYNSFAREDKIIMHEYTHAVTDLIAGLSYGYTETGAIHEGNSDYFPAAFTERAVIGEYAAPAYQRDITNPIYTSYTAYLASDREPHRGGQFWSASLWDIRTHASITPTIADMLIYTALDAIPTNSTFLQYRQAIIDMDAALNNGVYGKLIAHLFYVRGIGPDSLGVTISGPSTVYHADPKGTPPNCYTWTANASGGTGPYSYAWTGGYGTPSGSSYNECFSWNGFGGGSYQYTLRVKVTDSEGDTAIASKLITAYNSGNWWGMADGEAPVLALPEEFSMEQNYPNPFNPETEIRFALPEPSSVTITVTDMLGREIVRLADGTYQAGYQRVLWTSTDATGQTVGSGVYFCRIVATGHSGKQFNKVMKMIVTK